MSTIVRFSFDLLALFVCIARLPSAAGVLAAADGLRGLFLRTGGTFDRRSEEEGILSFLVGIFPGPFNW
jgi:hypothetical protein